MNVELRGPGKVEVVAGGALAGVAASLVLLLVVAVCPGSDGPVELARGIAAAWLGLRALVGGPEVVLLGLLTHLVIGAAAGVGFSLFVRDDTPVGIASSIGLLWGAAAWLAVTFGALPSIDPVLYARLAVDPWPWLFGHVAFGIALGATPWLQRRLGGRRRIVRPGRPVLVLHTFRRR